MSDRKYRQRGYQDEPREPRRDQRPPEKKEYAPRGQPPIAPKTFNMPGFREVVRCARCGNELTVAHAWCAEGSCSRCGADLHSCAQCVNFDTSAAFECQKPVRARVSRDSLWLASGYAATAGSGFVFWLLAAVWIPQSQLGIEASVLAAVMAAAALASNGPGSALVVMLPLGGPAARETLRRALAATAVLALVLGIGAGALVAGLLPSALPPVWIV